MSKETELLTVHKVKILPKYFEKVKSGVKTFEYRKDDRDYKVGDRLKLMEYDLEIGRCTGNILEVEITYILRHGDFKIPSNYVIMSIKKV